MSSVAVTVDDIGHAINRHRAMGRRPVALVVRTPAVARELHPSHYNGYVPIKVMGLDVRYDADLWEGDFVIVDA